MLEVMKENSLFAKLSKFHLGLHKVEYLGHFITAEGVVTDPSRIHAMMDWPVPQTLKHENIVAGALSRVECSAEINSLALSTITSDLQQKVKDSYEQDNVKKEKIQQLTSGTYNGDKYTWEGSVLNRKGKIVLGNERVH
ncbi:hypothetical protein Tco_0691303 [Tanacetum coccineum]